MEVQTVEWPAHGGHSIFREAALAGIEEARAEAVKALPDMARDGLPDGDYREFVVHVRDEAGQRVLRARLTLVVERLPHAG
jgi:hypothetical protein